MRWESAVLQGGVRGLRCTASSGSGSGPSGQANAPVSARPLYVPDEEPVSRLPAAAARADIELALRVQRSFGGTPGLGTAKALSAVGEHAMGWFVLTGVGAAVDTERRSVWLRAGAAAFTAHAAAVVTKRVVRRRRPAFEGLLVHAGTPSALSFPSSHAASTTATAVALVPVLGPVLLPVAAAMGVARVLLGVHFPSDVLVGSALGAAIGAAAARGGPGA